MATRKTKKPIPKAKPAPKLRALSGGRQAKPAASSAAKGAPKRGTETSQSVDTCSNDHEAPAIAEEATGDDNLPLAVLGDAIDVEEQSLDHASLEDMFKLVSAAPDTSIQDESNLSLPDIDQDDIDEPTLRPPGLHDLDSLVDEGVETEDDGNQTPVVAVDGDLLEGLGDISDTAALLRHAIEAMLFVSDKPISLKDLSKGLQLDKKRTMELLGELRVEYENRGIRIDEVADGYAFRTHPSVADYVRNFLEQRPVKLSRAQLETLSIVAYRQPITRPEVDDIRGVDCGPVLKGLLERDLVRILGKKDEPGRPMLYGTTPSFLELLPHFWNYSV
jgi:segregation and condensation protein B